MAAGQTGRMDYDPAGNLVNDTYTSFGRADGLPTRLYNGENRMTTALDASLQVVSSYSYNADGQRSRRKIGAVETWQIYGMEGELLAEYAVNAGVVSLQKEYGYRNGQLLITAEPPTGQAPPLNVQNVSWANVSGTITVTGNSIQKTSGTNSWYDAGAVSTQSIASGNGYMDFVAGEAQTWRMAGLGNSDTSVYFGDIEYAFFMDGGGGLAIYEAGNYRGQFGTYAASDHLKVAVENGAVKYYRNTTLLYTSTVAPQYPLLVDTSLNTVNSGIYNVVIANNVQNVSWANVSGTITVTGNSIQKTSGTNIWYDAGAVSTQTIASGNGYMDFVPGEAQTWRMAGLGNTDTSVYFGDIEYAFFMDGGGGLAIYEAGNYRGQFGTYAASDHLKVAVENGAVKYYRNATLLYTSTVAPQYPLLVDTSLNTVNSGIYNVVITSTAPLSTGNTNWLVTDQLGTPRMVIDKTGALANVKRHDYLPFGEELGLIGGRTAGMGYNSNDNVRQKFTLYERDIESGLDYANARYFASKQGRFTSPDPMLSSGNVAEPQSWNRYAYVLNNPLAYVDPTGLIWGYQDGTNGNGERVRTFVWFEGDTVDEGWDPYYSSHYVGRDEVLWLDSGSSAFLQIARSNFGEGEYASLLGSQGPDCTAFSDQQRNIVNREIADEVGRSWQFGLMKGIAGIAGGAGGSLGGAVNFTFGATARQANRLPPILFHYASAETGALIESSQVGRPGGQLFLTNAGNYTSAQARELLALPRSNSAGALFAIDTQALRNTPAISRGFVQPANNRLGGGFEFVFNGTVQKGSFTRFRF